MKGPFARFAASLARRPGQHPTAFCSLRGVFEDRLEVFDGVRIFELSWESIRWITASMGQQQYDMTRILTIEHTSGATVFLPEGEALWAPFIAAMGIHLRGVLAASDWMPRLSTHPNAVIRVYRA